jgi:hypothetical protein
MEGQQVISESSSIFLSAIADSDYLDDLLDQIEPLIYHSQ